MGLKHNIKHSKELSRIFQIAKDAGGEARFVGGAVRNFLLYNTPLEGGDVDLSLNLPVSLVSEIFKQAGAKVITKYATNIVILKGKVFEITSTRKDENCDGRYAEMIFTPSFEEDAKRRDFTINALYMSEDGEIFDFFDGLLDLEKKIVKFIGNPEFRIEEDGLRIWRFFRFSCLYGSNLNEEGFLACIKKRAILKRIANERVTAEFLKLLEGKEEKIKFILSKMIEAEILKKEEFNLDVSLPKDVFERFAVITKANLWDKFTYSAKQKKLILLYNQSKPKFKEKAEIFKLFYTLTKEDFDFISSLASSLEGLDFTFNSLPNLPFSKQSILKEGFEGGEITKEYNKRLDDFCQQLYKNYL